MANFKEIVNGDTPVLVDFHADWCGPCQTMNPIIDQLAKDEKGKIRILKVNIDKNPQAANAFQVRGVPTFLLFKAGKVVWRASGAMPLSDLKGQLAYHLG